MDEVKLKSKEERNKDIEALLKSAKFLNHAANLDTFSIEHVGRFFCFLEKFVNFFSRDLLFFLFCNRNRKSFLPKLSISMIATKITVPIS